MKKYQELMSMKRTIENYVSTLDHDNSAILANKRDRIDKCKMILRDLEMFLHNYNLYRFVFSEDQIDYMDIITWEHKNA